jgi:putative peptidoglycan lipid II flippase
MVSKILKLFNKELPAVNEAALMLGLFTFVSQILGLYRDRLLAYVVGPGEVLDVYYAAFRIPDFLYLSIASLASITVLMPFIASKISSGSGYDSARRFLNNVFSAYMIFMVISCSVIYFVMPSIARYIAPGFNADQINLLVSTSRLMLLSPIFIGLSNLLGTITQLFKNFLIFSLSPIFYNLGIIAGIFIFYPIYGVSGLGLGVVLGALLHLLIQLPVIAHRGFFPSFRVIDWREIYSVVKVSLPRTLTLSFGSLAFLLMISIASTIESGSISIFNFAFNLQSVPVGIIGISYSVAAFPTLVRSFSDKNMNVFIGHVVGAIKQILFWTLPVISLVVVLRAQIVRVALGTHSFSWSDTRLTAAAAALFVFSLTTQSLVLLIIRAYYATGNTRKPLLVNLFSSLFSIALSFSLIYLFKNYPHLLKWIEDVMRVRNVSGTMMFALPIAYVSASVLNFILIFYLFKKDFLADKKLGILKTFTQSMISALSMGAVAYFMLNILSSVLSLNTGFSIFIQGFVSGVSGIIFGVLVLYLLKNQEFFDICSAVKKKFWRSTTVAPEQSKL